MVIDENSGWRAFISFIQEYFRFEFPELDEEYKNKTIEEILLHNNNYITKEEVMAEQDLCSKCGRCCRTLHCPYFDYDTNLCTRHNNQLMDICREYPYSGEYGIQPLSLNCGYQKKFFLRWFTKFFSKVVEMNEENKSK